MLVENKEARTRSIDNLFLLPGVNEVDSKLWQKLMMQGYKRPVEALIKEGILSIISEGDGDEKVTPMLVKKTYDLKLLEAWLEDAKGPLKKAIRDQIKEMTEED